MTMLANRIAEDLQLSRQYVETLARKASHVYKVYTIPKKDGTRRTIHHPSKELKAVQRWINTNVLCLLRVHQCAMAYRKGLGIKHNAAKHKGSRYLLRMDLEGFFPSITNSDVRLFLTENAADAAINPGEDVALIERLVCRNGSLTIGAPTSPALSNAMCYLLDERLAAISEAARVTYTRYADDLFFSTDMPGVLRTIEAAVPGVLRGLPWPAQLQVNAVKTKHSSRKSTRRVTGIVLTSDGGISVGRDRKRAIRALIHKWDNLGAEERQALAGLLAYVADVEPGFINRLVIKYGASAVARARVVAPH